MHENAPRPAAGPPQDIAAELAAILTIPEGGAGYRRDARPLNGGRRTDDRLMGPGTIEGEKLVERPSRL
jgi:hypothetical protein